MVRRFCLSPLSEHLVRIPADNFSPPFPYCLVLVGAAYLNGMARPVKYTDNAVAHALIENEGNMTKTALALGCNRQTVYNTLARSSVVKQAKSIGIANGIKRERKEQYQREMNVWRREQRLRAEQRRCAREALPDEERKPIAGRLLNWMA